MADAAEERSNPSNTPSGATDLPKVHVMPSDYLARPQRKTPQPSSSNTAPKKTIPTWVVIVLLAVAGLVAILVAFFVLRATLLNDETPGPIIGNFNTPSNENANTNANVNSNTNSNANVNANVNSNTNVNSNQNANANTNTNANVNSNTNSNANRNTNTSVPLERVPLPPATKDSDNDDLTDKEETVFLTTATKPDTDADGYIDSEEVLNLYDPTVPGQRLSKAIMISEYRSIDYDYTILYPESFAKAETPPSKKDVMFTADTGEFIGVSIVENSSGLTAKEWYADQLGSSVDPEDLPTLMVSGKEGVMGLDDRTAYVDNGKYIYVITYNFGIKTEINFYTTFLFMLESFTLTSPD